MKNIKTALLISTYNWPGALNLVLKSISEQSVLPDEVLIADDGSDDVTKEIIASFKNRIKIPVQHIWHEDKGFRKSIILNKAIAASVSDYIIQVDGDCLLHSHFIEDHLKNIEQGLYLYGTRVRVKEKYVDEVINSKKLTFNFFSRGIKKRPRSIRLPFINLLFKKHVAISPKFRGCNTSYWKKDFILVNGYNEDIEGWGREDSELMIRLHNSGIKAKRLKFCGIVYHLDHNEKSRERFKNNNSIQQKTIEEKLMYCDNGIDKYL